MKSYSVEYKVFLHHVYEYQKGVRRMVLCTLRADELADAEERLSQQSIPHFHQWLLRRDRANLFFGDRECLEALNLFLGERPLNSLTPEEDFIVGAMLGYDIGGQCERYCKRKRLEQLAASSELSVCASS